MMKKFVFTNNNNWIVCIQLNIILFYKYILYIILFKFIMNLNKSFLL